jgi:DNA-binding NarL/FixJ family response regulator
MNALSISGSAPRPAAVFLSNQDTATLSALDRLLSQDTSALHDLTVGELFAAVRGLQTTRPFRLLHSVIPAPLGMSEVLSDRELQVVRLVAEGLSNKEISGRLSLSDKTVKNHISHILAKLNLSARTQVAIRALRDGIA